MMLFQHFSFQLLLYFVSLRSNSYVLGNNNSDKQFRRIIGATTPWHHFHRSSYVYPCIPVMGTGVVADPLKFSLRLVNSIDFCIENFILTYARGLDIALTIEVLNTSKYIKNLTVIEHKYRIFGVSEGWNNVLRTFPRHLWYLIIAYDVEFMAGQLSTFSHRFWNESGWINKTDYVRLSPSLIRTNFAFVNYANMGPSGYNVFAMSYQVIRNVGYFDENIFPAFYEDNDWNIRCLRWSNLKWLTYMEITPWHGIRPVNISKYDQILTENKVYNSGTNFITQRIPEWQQLKDEGTKWNLRYLRKKWGCEGEGISHHNCHYKRPFGNISNPISYWVKDTVRIEKFLQKFGFIDTKTGTIPKKNITTFF